MPESGPARVLSLFDTTNLIVGIIVGAGIFVAAPVVARGAGSGAAVLGLWAAGGLLSFCGAVGYAELATTYPEEGGDLVYLTRAYGRWAGFLFGWIQTEALSEVLLRSLIFSQFQVGNPQVVMGFTQEVTLVIGNTFQGLFEIVNRRLQFPQPVISPPEAVQVPVSMLGVRIDSLAQQFYRPG